MVKLLRLTVILLPIKFIWVVKTVSRAISTCVDLSGIPFDERISRHHAYVMWDNHLNSFTIGDDNSTNGTMLNGQSLIPQRPYTLHTGDRLEFGREQKVVFTVKID